MSNPKSKLFDLLNKLEKEKIPYQLAHVRENALMVQIATPGARWEIEFTDGGTIEIEKFISDGAIRGEDSMNELFANLSTDASD